MAIASLLGTTTLLSSPLPRSNAVHTRVSLPMAVSCPVSFLNRRVGFRRIASLAAPAVLQVTDFWNRVPLIDVRPAAESLFHVCVDVSESPHLARSYTQPGQYVQLRLSNAPKPSYLAIASPPSLASTTGLFEFLVKSVSGSTAEILCGLEKGNVVEMSQAMGTGFDVDRISLPEKCRNILIFATGSAISPIRSLLESGFRVKEKVDARLYYGAQNLRRMAYQERFNRWRSAGVDVIPVLSQADSSWRGENGYVQAAFSRGRKTCNPLSTGAVLCGHKRMTEEVTSLLIASGVSADRILKNF